MCLFNYITRTTFYKEKTTKSLPIILEFLLTFMYTLERVRI